MGIQLAGVESDDLTFILENSIDDLLNGFGGSGGKEEFVQMWDEVKPMLSRSLSLGGYFVDESMLAEGAEAEFIAPYTNQFIFEEAEWSDDMEFIGIIHVDAANVFLVPGGELLQTLGRVVVLVNDWYPMVNSDPINPDWVELEFEDGGRGYVSASEIISPVDFRCFFEKVDDRWFYAGWAAGV
jgi:hypothetical protein